MPRLAVVTLPRAQQRETHLAAIVQVGVETDRGPACRLKIDLGRDVRVLGGAEDIKLSTAGRKCLLHGFIPVACRGSGGIAGSSPVAVTMKRPPEYGVPSGPEIMARQMCILLSETRAQIVDETDAGSAPPIMSAASSASRLVRAASCVPFASLSPAFDS